MNEVYILLSLKDGRTYVGSTDDLKRRLEEHNSGKTRSTRYRRPLKLIYTERFTNLSEARSRERQLKTTSGRRELKKIFKDLNIGE